MAIATELEEQEGRVALGDEGRQAFAALASSGLHSRLPSFNYRRYINSNRNGCHYGVSRRLVFAPSYKVSVVEGK